MKLQSLTIAPKMTYSPAGPNNPYEAKLHVSYNENVMQIRLDPETCHKILALAAEEIAAAANIQIREFVQAAIAVSATPMIEGKAE